MQYAKDWREKNGHWRQLYPAAAAAIDARRRMLVQAATVESFMPRQVYERDGWLCQLCRLPIDSTIAWPDPQSPSIDHVVPLAKGGEHSMTNVQAAHVGCNSRKGDQLGVDLGMGLIA
ncbi:HNH endonuclease [Streptomyces sp. NPDC006872]|uniref:HNH endonuclease n=1 Tax=Streptomyces sp. NPDC006872 TaxID=3155720 RepID=UPI0033D06CCE